MSALLKVDGLHVAYGRVEAVQGASLSVAPGTIATVIGANGAGKTTLLAALMGLLPSKGAIAFEGADLTRTTAEERVGLGISLVPEQRDLFSAMTVSENLELGAFRRGRREIPERLDEVYQLFPRLKERRRQEAGTLSGGERQMLAMGRALMARPRLLMLDEPSLGLAPLIVRDILSTVSRLRETGVSILLVEQNARAALRVADTAYVMELGQITLTGTADEIAANPRVSEIYLGGAH
ncbi:ABC transporter ATP-binding protein [Amorphus orientalis]|uniref:Branched-chain amino acid transport system ATP-binding protein n=1 Tax=Amorphus orientalis TaxID=649198 RepID=A0AAE3VR53_9HYPH|nr:ABC transporter ATP-binding protein [Amorphus orientalis]MDQ0316458.1 branched-chain amino acid transport system ATP-binding protein [Amorphus orientalis]